MKSFEEELRREKEPRILGKISIMRHGETKYTNQFPDLTDKGKDQAREKGRELNDEKDEEGEDVTYAASPSARAQGTMSLVLEELGEKDADMRILDAIRSVEIRNPKRAGEMVDEVTEGTGEIARMDRAYANDARFENMPDVWQPRSEVERRFYRGLEYAIRSFIKNDQHRENEKIPHLIAVSHFEFLNHFVARVFGLDLKKDNLLGLGEMVEMTILEPNSDLPDSVPIRVLFRGEEKNIIFDRKSRSINIE